MRLLPAVVIASIATLGLVACGDDDSTTADTTPAVEFDLTFEVGDCTDTAPERARKAKEVNEVLCDDPEAASEVVAIEGNLGAISRADLPKCPDGSEPFHGNIETLCLAPIGSGIEAPEEPAEETTAETTEDSGDSSGASVESADELYDSCIEQFKGSAVEDIAESTCANASEAFEECFEAAAELDGSPRDTAEAACKDTFDEAVESFSSVGS